MYFENYKLLAKFVNGIGATKSYGDEDVWDFLLNSSSKSVEYVNFRDFSNKAVYSGYVELFSQSGQMRELVLRDVKVYDFEGLEMYAVARLYISCNPANVHLELPL